jgi:hypothetical protein
VAIAALFLSTLLAGDPERLLNLDVLRAWIRNGTGALAVGWMLAALGYGRALRQCLFREMPSEDARRGPLALALGVAALLALDSLLARVGMFRAGGTLAMSLAALPLLAGLVLLAPWKSWRNGKSGIPRPWAAWLALPALAALALAAAVPPGLLWSTEFGGYDALSYHLQVPREWLELGAAAPLRHNVYSAQPSFVECATLNLFALAQWSEPRAVAHAAQLLHALLAVSAAWIAGCAAGAAIRAGAEPHDARRAMIAHVVTWCFIMGVPWILVTGSLAYNEMGVLICMAGALLAWQCGRDSHGGALRLGLALGLLLGAAMGSKLTAVGMVVAPMVVWTLCFRRPGALKLAGIAALTSTAVLLPWLVRNAITTEVTGGNPVFPFAPELLGHGWWSVEQSERFARAHSAWGSLSERLAEFWYQGPAFGLVRSPYSGEPWLPQWSVAWWVAGVAFVVLWVRGQRRIASAAGLMLLVQLAFWLLATHMKSRFLIPCVIPMGILVGSAASACASPTHATDSQSAPLRRSPWQTAGMAGALLMLVVWCMQPLNLFFYDPRTRGRLDLANAFGYDGLRGMGGPADVTIEVANPSAQLPFAWAANYAVSPQSVIATEGEAAVFWCANTPMYGTVWDGGPLTQLLRRGADQPMETIRALGATGATHLVVNTAMLDRWQQSGWLDPAVTPGRLQSILSRMKRVRPLVDSGTLFEIP